MKVIVVYDTKYGNTKIVAEKIVEGMREVGGVEVVIADVKEVNFEEVASSDALLMGHQTMSVNPRAKLTLSSINSANLI